MESAIPTVGAPNARPLSRRTFGALSLLGIAGAPLAATRAKAADQLDLKMQFASPDGTPWNQMDRRFASQVEQITGGKIQFFPPNSVTPFKDWLRATGTGLLDLGFVWHPVLPGKFPQMELFGLPGLSMNQTVASIVYWRLREEFPKMGELFTKADNVVNLATFVAMGSHLHSRDAIRHLTDLKGKVFASQDSAGVEVLQKLGATASVMVGPDAYLALQRGAVDGVLCAWGWVNNFKLNEVTKYHTLLNLNPGSYSSVMNRDTYERLTPEAKSHLADIRPMYFLYNTTDAAAAAMAGIPADNVLTLPSDEMGELTTRMQPLWADWVKKADGMGMDGQKVLDEASRLMKLYNQN